MDAKKRGENILDDIVEEILVKVPVKSLVRFKAVSRQWRGTIESKWFADKQVRSQKSLGGGQARVVRVVRRCFRTKPRSLCLTLENLLLMPPNGLVYYSSPYGRIKHPRLPRRGYQISEPCDGLFCISTKDREITLVNPATNSSRILPDPNPDPDPNPSTLPKDVWRRQATLVGIGSENVVSPRYKVVCFFKADKEAVNKSTRCKVLALDSNTWRYVDPPNCQVYYDHPIIYLDGVLYCFGYDNRQYYPIKLVAFDLHTETFQTFSVTPDVGSRYLNELSMCALNHRLCIFRSVRDLNREDLFFNIWGLDIKKGSLEIMYSIEYSRLPPELHRLTIIPVATINNYVILSDRGHSLWVFYGSKTHLFRGNYNSSSRYFMSFFETLVSLYQ